MTVHSIKEAWSAADRIFPTDYMQDVRSSMRAGYDVYRSTSEGHFYDYICDLGSCLEINLMTGKTVRIWIEEPKNKIWDYNGQY